MSYQVNFHLYVPDCEYWESEQVSLLRQELQEAFIRVLVHAGIPKQAKVSGPEVAYLAK